MRPKALCAQIAMTFGAGAQSCICSRWVIRQVLLMAAPPAVALAGSSVWRTGPARRCAHFGDLGAARGVGARCGRRRPRAPSSLVITADYGGEAETRPAKAERKPSEGTKGLVDDQLMAYVRAHTRESELELREAIFIFEFFVQILREVRLETSQMPGNSMQVSVDQAQLLAMLVRLMGARQCIEVGVLYGYSALAIGLAIPDSGNLVVCDRSEPALAIAQRHFQRAGISHKVDVRFGLAMDTLSELLQNGDGGRYDFAFVDADKKAYPQYYELLLKLLRPGGLVVFDNVLWKGKVANSLIMDHKTRSIREFNDFLAKDNRINYSMVTSGDGMALCRKL